MKANTQYHGSFKALQPRYENEMEVWKQLWNEAEQVVFAGSWNAVDANTRGSNFKELGTHPDPSCLFTVAQQLVQQLTAKKN